MKRPKFSRGAIALVALSFVSVLGLVLAGYFAISQQSMRLSNRSYGATVSAQLAELGLEEALRAITTNNFADWTSGTAPNQTSVDWTLSGTTATATITPPATRYGNSGVTGTAKIRIDNYDAFNRPATWANGTAYRIGDLIGDAGTWYRCVQNHTAVTATNQPPNLSFWVPAPIPWQWSSDTPYNLYDVVNYLGIWYRCISNHNATFPFTSSVVPLNDTTRWATIPSSRAWTTGTSYVEHDVVRAANAANDIVLYRCTVAHTSGATLAAHAANWSTAVVSLATSWARGTVYPRGALVFENGFWYICAHGHTAGLTFANDLALSPPVWSLIADDPDENSWRSTTQYVVGDYIYDDDVEEWYRCIANSLNNPSSDPTYWTAASTNRFPYFSWAWRSTSYRYNSVVFHSASGAGTWYRCIAQGNTNPTTASWENALTASFVWSATANYNIGDAVFRSGSWYRCTVAHINQGPPNAAFWATTPLRSPAWDSGRHYAVDDMALYGGVWYRCLTAHNGLNPSLNAATWSAATNAANNWNSTTAYTTASRVTYGNVWYRCVLANTNVAPGNTTYWTAMGAPVIYAEGTATLIRETVPLRTQLRANVAVAPLVPNAVAGTTTLTINGAGTVDSYDAQRGTYASQTPGFSAVLAAGLTTGTAATITDTTVHGYVAAPSASAAPHAPLTSFGGSAAVTGTLAGTTVDQTRVSRSPFIPQFDPLPNSLRGTEIENGDLTTATSDTLNLGTPGATTPSRYFFDDDNGYGAGNLNLGNPSSGFSLRAINILGPVIIYVNGYLYIRGGTTILNAGIIDIKSTGSLELHCGVFRSYAGSHGFFNRTLDPTKLTLIADSNSNSLTYLRNGNSAIVGINKEFYGVLYAPNTTATVGLGIQTGAVIYGAISAREVTFSAEANVSYDTTLRSTAIPGVDRAFMLTDWRELTSPAERVTLP